MDKSSKKGEGFAKIIGINSLKTDICAAAARISTTNGTAKDLLQKSIKNSNNDRLIKLVLSSGHQSIMEHCYFNLAFTNVSVFVEQFMIEFRLASFTVQSRRYVDFRNAGFYTDEQIQEDIKQQYSLHMQFLFSSYGKLLDLGIPKEDARFILPYCFHSNFYCSCNARELLHIICAMVFGRGSVFPELFGIGVQLAQQFNDFFPDEVEKHKGAYLAEKEEAESWLLALEKAKPFPEPQFSVAVAEHLAHTSLDEKTISRLSIYGFATNNETENYKKFILSTRSRELEFLNISFLIRDISLSALTHFVRHRIQSVLVPCVGSVFFRNHFVLPSSIDNDLEAKKIFIDAINENSHCLNTLIDRGLACSNIVYFALSGNTLNILSSMNGRELVHFFSLRLCNRAQWEIRTIAGDMLNISKRIYPSIFSYAGPSCVMKGVCPEGNKTCGRLLLEKK